MFFSGKEIEANVSKDLVVRMGLSGSTMSGPTIPSKLLGPNSTASATFRLREKVIRPLWLAMSCIYLGVGLSRAKTWATWQHSELHHGAGTRSKTWGLRRLHGQGTA